VDREKLKKLLPHREPMLLLDEAVCENGVATAKYHVTGDEWFLQGHFPGNPVVPGVILCEIMAQACGVLMGETIYGKTPYYTGIDKTRFKRKVLPGDVIVVSAKVEKSRDLLYFTNCEVRVDGELCAKGTLSFMLVEGR